MNITIETQIVGNGSYGIHRDFDPIGVFHVMVDHHVTSTWATLEEAVRELRKTPECDARDTAND
jgi:hypothetical protein